MDEKTCGCDRPSSVVGDHLWRDVSVCTLPAIRARGSGREPWDWRAIVLSELVDWRSAGRQGEAKPAAAGRGVGDRRSAGRLLSGEAIPPLALRPGRLVQVLHQQDLVPLLVVKQFIHKLFGHENAETTRAHSASFPFGHVEKRLTGG